MLVDDALAEYGRRIAFVGRAYRPQCVTTSGASSLVRRGRRTGCWMGERALRLSPFDPLSYLAYDSISVGHFRLGRYEEAVNAARKAIQFNPGFSINYVLLAAPLAKALAPR